MSVLQATVQCLRAARGNKAHTLHALSGSVLQGIVAAAGTRSSCTFAGANLSGYDLPHCATVGTRVHMTYHIVQRLIYQC
jgi:hypothetical protein